MFLLTPIPHFEPELTNAVALVEVFMMRLETPGRDRLILEAMKGLLQCLTC
jgi:hypothetical protein